MKHALLVATLVACASPALGALAFDKEFPVVLGENSTYVGELGFVTVREATEFRAYDTEPMYEADVFGRPAYFRSGEEYCSEKMSKLVRCDAVDNTPIIEDPQPDNRIAWAPRLPSYSPAPNTALPSTLPPHLWPLSPLPCNCGSGGHEPGKPEPLPAVPLANTFALIASAFLLLLLLS